jgi:Glycosyltransferases involved in cell wall biogenesis
MADLSAIILTKNESKNIVECFNSIKDIVKRVVIVDCGSTDNTVDLAKDLGADVYIHPFENYAKQFNWALDNTKITSKWALRLDADERFTPALCDEVENLMTLHNDDNITGLTLEANLYFMGKRLKHGERMKRKIMIFKFGIGRIENRKMDEHTILSSGSSIAVKEKFIHYDFKNIDYFISKYNWYATREMQDYFAFKQGTLQDIFNETLSDKKIQSTREKKFGLYYKAPPFFRAWMLFVLDYYFKLGFLDGKEGYIYHFLHNYWYRCLVDAKIYEQEKTNSPWIETGDLKT